MLDGVSGGGLGGPGLDVAHVSVLPRSASPVARLRTARRLAEQVRRLTTPREPPHRRLPSASTSIRIDRSRDHRLRADLVLSRRPTELRRDQRPEQLERHAARAGGDHAGTPESIWVGLDAPMGHERQRPVRRVLPKPTEAHPMVTRDLLIPRLLVAILMQDRTHRVEEGVHSLEPVGRTDRVRTAQRLPRWKPKAVRIRRHARDGSSWNSTR